MTDHEAPALGDIESAARRIAAHIHRTPFVHSETLSRITGKQVFLKCENLQKTGSFKVRGALNRLATLSDDDRERGVITISAGNHAQGVAYAARALGVRALIVMPEAAAAGKVAATRGYGAECVLHGDVHAAFEKLAELRQERDLYLVHPFSDPQLVAGHGTIGLEVHQELAEFDAVVCGIGGGGLIGGVASACKALVPGCRVYGVEPEGAATMSAALAAGKPVHLQDLRTIADGLAPPMVGELNLAIAREHVDAVSTVSDEEIRKAMLVLLERTKLLVEPAGAAALAALMENRLDVNDGERVVLVLSGGNVDMDRLAPLLSAGADEGC
jgi:threonine dehydratase